MVKEKLGIRTGGLTIQNVGTAPTTIYVDYYEYGTGTKYTFWTKSTIAVGAAIGTNNVSVNGATYFNNDGSWTWSALNAKEFSAVAYTLDAQKLIVLVGENTPNATMDMSNYEGINY
jgi:hypothetical protein